MINKQFIKDKYKNIEFKSDDDFIVANNVSKILSLANIEMTEEMLSLAIREAKTILPKNKNDFMYLAVSAVSELNCFKKTAYTLMDGSPIAPQFDVGYWSKLVYKIYDDVTSGRKNIADALEYHSSHLPDEKNERANFIKWFNFYQKSENKKYAGESMDKKAFGFPLMGSGLYAPNTGATAPSPSQIKEIAQSNAEKNISSVEWKGKLDKALRSIDRLLRDADNHLSAEEQDRLLDLYYDFNRTVRGIRFHTTAADKAFNVANQFRKFGFTQGADILSKFAQEAPPPVDEVNPTEELSPIEEAPQQPAAATEQPPVLDADQREVHEEYNSFPQGVDISMAISKLEDVAGILSDRRIIRTLAEFDIILDKMGVASMFPELSEAQSRLIDAYSYSLTRVSKMLGMLSSGKSVAEIAGIQSIKQKNQVNKEINKTIDEAAAPVGIANPDGNPAETQIQQEFAAPPPAEQQAPAPQAPPPATPN